MFRCSGPSHDTLPRQVKWETFCTNRPYLSLYFSFANNLQCIFLISFPVKKSRWKVHFNAYSLLRLFFSMPLSAIIQYHWFFYRFELFPCICCKKMTLHYIFGCDVEYKWMLFSLVILSQVWSLLFSNIKVICDAIYFLPKKFMSI